MHPQAAQTDPSEEAPLISTPGAGGGHDAACGLPPDRRKPSPTHVVVLLLLFVVLLDLGYELIVPAQTRVLESIYCEQYYREHDPSLIGSDGKNGVDEKLCKVPWVQGQVATLKGYQLTLDSLGMLVFSVPWASVADIHGRKKVMLLLTTSMFAKYAYVQAVCAFRGAVPLRWAWLSALHTAGGGGVAVATALMYTVISDVVAARKRVAVFFQVTAANITTQFIGSLLSAVLMIPSPWIPMLLGLGIELASILVLCALPETLHYNDPHAESAPPSEPPRESESNHLQSKAGRGRRLRLYARDTATFLVSDRRILFIISAFVIHMLFLNRDILLQYISTRYGVTLAQATVFISVRSGLIFLLSTVLLPAVTLYLRKRLGPGRSDLYLARISAGILSLGFLGVGLAPSLPPLVCALVVNSFGWGLFGFLRSLATSLVEAHHVARLNSFIGVFDTIGLMVGSPLLAALFTHSINLSGPWTGLPFLFCAGVVAGITFVLLRIRL